MRGPTIDEVYEFASSGGFVDCITDLPYDDYEQNMEYIQETFARFYFEVHRKFARKYEIERN